jgi:hypothetical protein
MRISEKVLNRSVHLSDAGSPKPLVGQKSCIFSLAGTNDIHMDVATRISSPLQHCQRLFSNSSLPAKTCIVVIIAVAVVFF